MVAQKEVRTLRDSNDYPNILELNRNDADDWLNAWNANDDNRWNRENLFVFLAPQPSLFPASGGVCFTQLPHPPAQHFAYTIEFFRKRNILFIVQSFNFPECLKKEFYQVKFQRGSLNV